jgi:hypothetical protein
MAAKRVLTTTKVSVLLTFVVIDMHGVVTTDPASTRA